MKTETYAENEMVEAGHWWYAGRRRLFARLIAGWRLSPEARILDAGVSTGPNLRLLAELGYRDVCGVDVSPEAVARCRAKGFAQVRLGDVCDLPFAAGQFDLVLLTDVIEHVDEDGKALAEAARVLRPGGRVLVTVPAFACLWGVSDEIGEHRRRYRLGQLTERIERTGLIVAEAWYFNYLLFLPILFVRKLVRWLRLPLNNENHLNLSLLNAAIGAVFAFDTWTARWLRPPFGVSILAVCRKPAVEGVVNNQRAAANGPTAQAAWP